MDRKRNKYILAKYDVSGIQDYIFASNRLREIAGASFQVTRILEGFLRDAFQKAASESDAKVILAWEEEDRLRLPQEEDIMAEIIYIGGGNATALFRDSRLFRSAGEELGFMLAKWSVGIDLVVAYIETDLSDFTKDRQMLDEKMSRLKRNMERQPLFSPFPVVEQDNASHQPITRCNLKGEHETQIQYQKRNAYKKEGGPQSLSPDLPEKYGYPEDMEQLCRRHGEDSQIAVIHIDGNGIGERMKNLISEGQEYAVGVSVLRRESKKIARLFQDTYADVLKDLWESQILIGGDDKDVLKNNLFPLRPILLDGDDFTILCRADLAVPIAAGFMMKLMQGQPDEQKITACGGIAFVHSHFPFRVAYTIAEESCLKAKKKWYQAKTMKEGEEVSCYLDFQIIKESEAEISDENITYQQRPYSLCLNKQRTDRDALGTLYKTLVRMEDWPSGRLQKLYRMTRRSDQDMEFLKREFKSRGYDIDGLSQGKWNDSPLIDALELQGLCHLELLNKFINIQ